MALYYVDGSYVKDNEASLPVSDMAILRGYAVFDFLRTYNGSPFHLEDHVLRFQQSAAFLNIPCPWSVSEIASIVDVLLEKNNFRESNLRFILTGGDSADSITPEDRPRLIIMATELKPFPQEWHKNGVKIITSEVTRYIPGAKSTNYIKAIMALRKARATGAIESIYVDEDGNMLEGTTSNIFAVQGDTVITAADDILPGITRKVVINLIKGEMKFRLENLPKADLGNLSEVFITSSNKEVIPVVQVDDVIIGDGPGPVTQKVMKLFRQYTESWR